MIQQQASELSLGSPSKESQGQCDWMALADRVLAGGNVERDEAIAMLQSPDEQLLDLLAAAYRVRRRYFGNRVQLYFLMNAKSGLCPEDCGYCSQSKVSEAEIPRYNLLTESKLMEGARAAAERKAATYCLVISARGPTEREIDAVTRIVPKIKAAFDLNVCACLGLLTAEHARRLKECGVDKVNHNLNTSRRFYPEICSTHTYQDRIDTLRAVRQAGLELCSGGILGMGETDADVVAMAFELRELGVESIPLNFLEPDRRHPACRFAPPDAPLLPQSAGNDAARESAQRIADRRRPGNAPRQLAAARLVRREFDVRRRLSDHKGPTSRSRLPDDRRNGLCRRG